jgi:hypothetical protein
MRPETSTSRRVVLLFRWSSIALLLAAVGLECEGFSTTTQCAQLAALTEESLTAIAELDSTGESAAPPNAYVDIAQHYRDLDVGLSELESELTKELRSGVTTYRGLLRVVARESDRYAEHLRELATASDVGDEQGAQKAQRVLAESRQRMERSQPSYDAALKRIENLCAPR